MAVCVCVCLSLLIFTLVAKMVIIYTDQNYSFSRTSPLVADVFVLAHAARVTLDRAAPHKLAVAFFLDVSNPSLVAAATAQQPTALDAIRGAIAEASPGAEDAEAGIFQKIVLNYF